MGGEIKIGNLKVKRLDQFRVKVLRQGKMRTEGLVFADEEMLKEISKDQSLQQVANVACLPGIIGYSMAMPDIHWGYGFPIGGVAAFEYDEGVISPGGVGYDINCGVRLACTQLDYKDVKKHVPDLVQLLFTNIPSGVGSRRKDIKLNEKELKKVLRNGARWAVQKGFGVHEDLLHIEEEGSIPGADPDAVSSKALSRGKDQLGTLGSGNHFVEVGYVDRIYDENTARQLGLFLDQLTVFVHTGSRGLGHQVCDDYIKLLMKSSEKYGIELPDKQLCCAPITSPEGQQYLGAMSAAANFAFANRQLIYHWVRETFEKVFGRSAEELGFKLLYDVCHNMAKVEVHEYEGEKVKVCVHRKGATRAFPPGHSQIPEDYRQVGQPVLIPGDMGRYSYVLVGTDQGMKETFGSSCHGAGRVLSRHQAVKATKGRAIERELADRGIYVKSAGKRTLKEECSEAYKDVSRVVNIVHASGIGKKVARLRPLGVIKG